MNVLNKSIPDNKEAFSDLIGSIENDLYNIAKAKINNPNDIEDILQETIIKIYKNYNNLNNKNFFKTWAIKILLNECARTYSFKKRDTKLFNKIITHKGHLIEDNSLNNLESELSFKALLSSLSPIEQNIFILYYQCKYSIKEISRILNLNENTIKSKLKRSKERLKEIYMKGGNK